MAAGAVGSSAFGPLPILAPKNSHPAHRAAPPRCPDVQMGFIAAPMRPPSGPNSSSPASRPARASSPPARAPTTFPCPGCGRPVAEGSAICTQCGQQIGREEQLQTRIKRPEAGLPPIPAIAPGPAAFRDAPVDPLAARERLKPIIILAASLAIVCAWKFAADGPAEASGYLLRYAITLAGALAVVAMGAMIFVEVGVSIPLAALGVAAAIAGGDLIQHAIHYTLMPALAWVAAIVACLMMLADFLELDFPDAVFLGFAIYLLKWVLKITLFAAMFEPAAPRG